MASLVTSGRSLAKRSLATEISLEMGEDQLASQEIIDSLRSATDDAGLGGLPRTALALPTVSFPLSHTL